jgi:hypothetical protein
MSQKAVKNNRPNLNIKTAFTHSFYVTSLSIICKNKLLQVVYLSTTPHDVKTQETNNDSFIAVITSDLLQAT